MNRSLRLACIVTLAALAAAAAGRPAAGQEAPAPSSHERAARELYRAMGGAKMAEVGVDAMIGVIRANPDLAPYEDVFRAWVRKVLSADDMERETARLYMAAFTEEEIQGLIAFYRSPLGQKAAQVFPSLAKQGAELGMRRAQEHQGELLEMIAQAKKEREAGKKPSP